MDVARFTGKCSETASVIFEAVTGAQIKHPMEDREDPVTVGGDFKGASYINLMESGGCGHRLVVIHHNNRHRIVQSNDLDGNGNKKFTCQIFMASPADKLDLDACDKRLTSWMTTVDYNEWLQELIEHKSDLEETRRLTGVGVRASDLFVKTLKIEDKK